ncbi:MAG: MarR family winged helix-turn-helix transcriptional regulator [Sarcina sp.]
MKKEISNLIRSITIKSKNKADLNLGDTGLSSKQARMIGYIYWHQEEGVIQNDLAKAFGKTKASITSMLQGLEKKGYIERVVSEENEREKKIYVLDKGVALVEKFKTVFEETEYEMYKGFSEEELESLKTLLEKMNNNL